VARAAVACPAPVRAATCFLASPFFPRSSSVDPGFPVSPHHFTALVNPPPILSTHQHSAVPPEADGRARRGHDYLGGTAYVPSTARGITLLLRDSWCRSVPGRYMRVWLMGSTTPTGVCRRAPIGSDGSRTSEGMDGRGGTGTSSTAGPGLGRGRGARTMTYEGRKPGEAGTRMSRAETSRRVHRCVPAKRIR
jgi:hypothetical protein